jgi:WD40 repeat protein
LGIARPCAKVRWDPTGSRLAVCSQDSLNVFIFDLASAAELVRLPHPNVLYDLAWNPAGNLIATACADNQVYVWGWERSQRTLLRGHGAPPREVVFTRAGSYLASLGRDKTLRLWDANTGASLVRWEGVSSEILALGPDDRVVACNLTDSPRSTLAILEVSWPEEVRSCPEIPKDPRAFGPAILAENGRLLIVPAEEGLHFWDVVSGQPLPPILMGRVQSVALLPEGRGLITRGFYGLHQLPFARARFDEERLLIGPPLFFDCAAGSGGVAVLGKDQVAAAEENSVSLLSVETGSVLHKLAAPSGEKTLAASSDGTWLAASSWGTGDLCVWHLPSLFRTNLSMSAPAQLAFSPDNKLLAAATDSQVNFWRVPEWGLVKTVRRQRPGLRPGCVAFAGMGGGVFAWTDAEGNVSISADAGKLLSLPSVAQNPVTSLEFSPRGNGLLVSTEGAPLTVWDLGAVAERLERSGLPLEWPLPVSNFLNASNPPLPGLLVNGEKIEHTQRIREDLQRVRAALLSDSNNFSAWREMGAIQSFSYRHASAIEAYRQALRLKSDDLSCLFECAYALTLSQRYPEAVEMYDRVLSLDPDNFGACKQLAFIYLNPGASDENAALGHPFAQKASEMKADDPDALLWLGVSHYRNGRFAEALSLIDRALALNPSARTFRFYQAICLAGMGQKAEARKAFEAALRHLEGSPAYCVQNWDYLAILIEKTRAACSNTARL